MLEHICRRRRIIDWKNYALVSQAEKVIVPLDRTVASLGGATELMLLEVSAIPQGLKPLGRSTDPNGKSRWILCKSVVMLTWGHSTHLETDIGSTECTSRCDQGFH